MTTITTDKRIGKDLIKYASGALALITLLGLIGNTSIRLNSAEVKAARVDHIEHDLRVLTIYMKLQDSTLYRRAENLAQ